MLAPVKLIKILFVLGLGALLGAGCASDRKGSSSAVLASVEIRERAPGEIADTAVAVFREHGYDASRHNKRDLVFEKQGSNFNRLAYGDWASGNSVWERVLLSIVPEGPALARLDCHAYLVADKGSPTEERVKYGHVKRAPLQAMLEEIATRLRAAPGETPQPQPQP
jgi:hypothetical protein